MPSANACAASRGTRPRTSRQPSRRIPARSSSGVEVGGARSRAGRRPRAGGRRPAPGTPGRRGAPSIRRMPARWRSRSSSPLGLGVAASSRLALAQPLRSRRAAPRCCRRTPPRSRRRLSFEPEHALHATTRPRAGRADHRRARRDVVDHDRVRADRGARADAHRRRSPWPRCRCSRRARSWRRARRPARRPIVTNGRDHRARVDLDEAVDHDLAVDDVDARVRRRPGRRSRPARPPSRAGARAAAGTARRARWSRAFRR